MDEPRAAGLRAALLDPRIQVAGLARWLDDAIEVSGSLDPAHLSVLAAQVAELADCAASSLSCTAAQLRTISAD